jgi:hypothetical protein
MLGSAVLETAVGLVFIYLVLSIIGTAIVEAYSGLLNCRGAYLKKWIRQTLGPKRADEFYDFPLIASLRRPSLWQQLEHPSYIPGESFAQALAYLLAGRSHTTDVKAVSDGAKLLGNTDVGVIIPILAEKSGGNFDVFLAEVNKWYTDCQNIVTGWFKVTSVRILLTAGILTAVLCNIDTIQIVNGLYRQTELRQSIAARAVKPGDSSASEDLKSLEKAGLVGWGEGGFRGYWYQTAGEDTGTQDLRPRPLVKSVGFLLTALAMSLGAPYWFEVLNKMNSAIRATGPKPESPKPD